MTHAPEPAPRPPHDPDGTSTSLALTKPTPQQPAGLGIDWLKTAAGALAAVSTTVLLSTLGAAGTLIGAAIGSVAATVGTALYSQGLAKSRRTMARAQEMARVRVNSAQADVRRAASRPRDTAAVEAHLERAEARLDQAAHRLDEAEAATAPRWGDRLRGLPWKRVALVSAALFLGVVAIVTVFELVSGRTVASLVGGGDRGGTTISHVTGTHGGGKHHQPTQNPTVPSDGPSVAAPTDSAQPSEGTSAEPTQPAEPRPTTTDSGLPSDAPTTAAPTSGPTSSPTPTDEPSAGEPTPSGQPSAE